MGTTENDFFSGSMDEILGLRIWFLIDGQIVAIKANRLVASFLMNYLKYG